MTTASEMIEETEANPYNARKDWHTESSAVTKGNADGMYFERPSKATSSSEEETTEAPEKKTQSTNYKKRYDDLKKHYDEKVANFKQKEQELRAMLQSGEPAYEPPKSVEDLEKFREEYPDLYETVETVAHIKSEAAIARKEAEKALYDRHPDFEDIRGDDNFHSWAEGQPEQIQEWIYNNPNNVNLAIKAIDLYKLENNLSSPKKRKSGKSQSSKSAADFVSTKTTSVDTKEPKIWTQREIASMSMRDFDKYEEEIDQAIMEGRVR
jgi:hypothetical protein